MRKYDIYHTGYGVTVTVVVHTDRPIVTPFDLSIECVCRHGKQVDKMWWETVNELQLYHVLCKDLNEMLRNLRA